MYFSFYLPFIRTYSKCLDKVSHIDELLHVALLFHEYLLDRQSVRHLFLCLLEFQLGSEESCGLILKELMKNTRLNIEIEQTCFQISLPSVVFLIPHFF